MFTSLLKDMVKGTDAQPNKEIRARSARVWRAGVSVPVEGKGITLQMWMCSLTWKLPKPHAIGVLGGFLK